MKNNVEYEAEELKNKVITIAIIVVFFIVVLVGFKPLDPGFDIAGFLVVVGFMTFFSIIMFLMFGVTDILKRNKFKKIKKEFILKGTKLKGTVIDSKEEVRVYVNGVPTKYKYIATIQTEDGYVFETPYLLINPNKLLTKEVTVYKKDDKYFATDFNYDFSQKEKKTKKEKFNHIHLNDFAVPSKGQCIITLIYGMIFSMFIGWILVKAADNMTRIIVVPFFTTSIGIFLQGLLPLFMIDKILAIKISKRVYMIGFLLYFFGFLIVWDYLTLRDSQINLFLLSFIFWIIGIYFVIRWFFIKNK